jgi:cytochrome P450
VLPIAIPRGEAERKGADVSTARMTEDLYYDPYDRDLLENPYPIFKRLRDEAPLYYNEPYDFYAVSRFDDVQRCLNDRATFVSRKGVLLEMIKADFEMPPGTLIHDEPPIHTAHRQLLSRVFTPRAMAAIEPMVREFCVRRLDPLVGGSGFDVVAELGQQVPMRVFGMLLGIPEDEQEAMRDHVEASLHTEPGQPQTYDDGFMNPDFYAHFLDDRYEHPSDDLITRLISTEFQDETGTTRTLTRDEALMYLMVVAGAGNHTTNRLIGWTAKVLAENPHERRAVVADRSLIPNAIEETLRYEPSSTQIARYVDRDVELYGQVVPEGSAFLCLVGAANRDERVFPDPDRFDVNRKFGHHLTFGYGAHFCLGAALARLEGRVVLEELLNRFTDWEVDYDNCRLGSSPGVRGYEALPIVII